jgi:hypothetical protein
MPVFLVTLLAVILTLTPPTSYAEPDCEDTKTRIVCLQETVDRLKTAHDALQQQVSSLRQSGKVSYTRWGRNSCPEGATLIYKGFAASGAHKHGGGISSLLCLTNNPTFAGFDDGNQNGALLYGTEYETSDYGIATLKHLHNSDAPCAVCLKPQATLTLMIPGTANCPADWNKEYEGFLMGTHYNQSSTHEAACVDIAPELRPSSNNANHDGNLWYPTETQCGSLPCPPYVANREVSCVVCTY